MSDKFGEEEKIVLAQAIGACCALIGLLANRESPFLAVERAWEIGDDMSREFHNRLRRINVEEKPKSYKPPPSSSAIFGEPQF